MTRVMTRVLDDYPYPWNRSAASSDARPTDGSDSPQAVERHGDHVLTELPPRIVRPEPLVLVAPRHLPASCHLVPCDARHPVGIAPGDVRAVHGNRARREPSGPIPDARRDATPGPHGIGEVQAERRTDVPVACAIGAIVLVAAAHRPAPALTELLPKLDDHPGIEGVLPQRVWVPLEEVLAIQTEAIRGIEAVFELRLHAVLVAQHAVLGRAVEGDLPGGSHGPVPPDALRK